MISNLLEEKALSTVSPQKKENCSQDISLITSNFSTQSTPNQVEIFTGIIESISNAASPASKFCVDQSVESIITQRQV